MQHQCGVLCSALSLCLPDASTSLRLARRSGTVADPDAFSERALLADLAEVLQEVTGHLDMTASDVLAALRLAATWQQIRRFETAEAILAQTSAAGEQPADAGTSGAQRGRARCAWLLGLFGRLGQARATPVALDTFESAAAVNAGQGHDRSGPSGTARGGRRYLRDLSGGSRFAARTSSTGSHGMSPTASTPRSGLSAWLPFGRRQSSPLRRYESGEVVALPETMHPAPSPSLGTSMAPGPRSTVDTWPEGPPPTLLTPTGMAAEWTAGRRAQRGHGCLVPDDIVSRVTEPKDPVSMADLQAAYKHSRCGALQTSHLKRLLQCYDAKCCCCVPVRRSTLSFAASM